MSIYTYLADQKIQTKLNLMESNIKHFFHSIDLEICWEFLNTVDDDGLIYEVYKILVMKNDVKIKQFNFIFHHEPKMYDILNNVETKVINELFTPEQIDFLMSITDLDLNK